mgnify:CR=1 FL=1
MKKRFILVNIGCLECGVSSNIVGVFTNEERAKEELSRCAAEFHWREGGQNAFEIFPMPVLDEVHPEYARKVKE